eukprot:9472955-Pyramimonas_sp.AAC.1
MVAITAGERDAVRALMKHGAKVDYENRRGETALIVAASTGNVALMDTLIECGAEVRTTTPLQQYPSNTPPTPLASPLQHLSLLVRLF